MIFIRSLSPLVRDLWLVSNWVRDLLEVTTHCATLLMNPHVPTWYVNEHGAWRMAGKFACVWIQICPLRLALSGVRHFKQHTCSRAFTSYSLVVHIPEDYELLHSTVRQNLRAARARFPRTPVHYTVILGVPTLHVRALMSSLKSNYTLY